MVICICDPTQIEANLRRRLAYEQLLSNISAQAVKVEDVNRYQDECLTAIGEELDVSRAYIFEHRPETDTVDNTFEWCAQGVTAQKENLQGIPCSGARWWMDTVKRGELICYEDIEDIPDDGAKELLRPQRVVSLLVVPLFVAGRWYGFMGFDECREQREWPQEDVDLLLTMSRIITGVIEREQTEGKMKKQLAELKRWHQITLDREERVAELKKEVNELLKRVGEQPRYGIG